MNLYTVEMRVVFEAEDTDKAEEFFLNLRELVRSTDAISLVDGAREANDLERMAFTE